MYEANFIGTEGKVEKFRDSISTVDKSGNRVWLYPKNPKGKFTTLRTVLAWLLIGLMFSGPFMRINGEPVLLLNIIERKFIIFGKIFWPQDFHIFLLITLAFMVFIVLFTVVYGRIFCGWICPQTIFMESVFRKIEYWIEGDYKTRMALDKAPLSGKKFMKKTLKHVVFFIISFIIANTFLSYILGVNKVLLIWEDHPENQLGTIVPLLVFTGVFYWVFAKFREQVCTTVCPYGRMQGVLLDRNSLVVIYDYIRGERRGKFKKNEVREEANKGDCIDCNQCVNVCPTGIDIRNGQQLECINCTACIDACDFMMQSVGLEKGLIRFDSEAGVAEKKKFRFTLRIAGYTAVLLILIGFIFTLLLTRPSIEATVLRTPGIMFQKLSDNKISNLYNIKMINKTSHDMKINVKLLSGEGEIKLIKHDLVLPSQGVTETAAFIILDQNDIKKMKTKVKVGIFSEGEQIETVNTTFIGPINN